MLQINKNSIVFGLSIVAIIAFGLLLLPTIASAQNSGGYWGGTGTNDTGNYRQIPQNQNYYSNNTYQAPNYYYQAPSPNPLVFTTPAPIVYSNSNTESPAP